jgi:glutamate mutase epsilon subunit
MTGEAGDSPQLTNTITETRITTVLQKNPKVVDGGIRIKVGYSQINGVLQLDGSVLMTLKAIFYQTLCLMEFRIIPITTVLVQILGIRNIFGKM